MNKMLNENMLRKISYNYFGARTECFCIELRFRFIRMQQKGGDIHDEHDPLPNDEDADDVTTHLTSENSIRISQIGNPRSNDG